MGFLRSVTGSKILRILKADGLALEIPEDLYHLIKKAVAIGKHLERNRKDRDSKYRLLLIESGIHRLVAIQGKHIIFWLEFINLRIVMYVWNFMVRIHKFTYCYVCVVSMYCYEFVEFSQGLFSCVNDLIVYIRQLGINRSWMHSFEVDGFLNLHDVNTKLSWELSMFISKLTVFNNQWTR